MPRSNTSPPTGSRPTACRTSLGADSSSSRTRTATGGPSSSCLRGRGRSSSALALLASPHGDLDRRALEAEGLTQPPLDEPPVPGVEEARGEEHEPRRLG